MDVGIELQIVAVELIHMKVEQVVPEGVGFGVVEEMGKRDEEHKVLGELAWSEERVQLDSGEW